MALFTEEQQSKEVTGIRVGDAVVALQVIDRAFSRGVVSGQESTVVGGCRDALLKAIETSSGVNYDQAMVQLQAQYAEQQRKAQQEQASAEKSDS